MKDILIDNKNIYNFEYNFLKIFSLVTKLTLLLFIFGIIQESNTLIIKMNFIVKICLGLFLMYRFNSYRKYKIKFTELDRKVAYSAGLYILLISFVDYTSKYIIDIRNYIHSVRTSLNI
jgi:hypothetical protein